MGLHRKTIPLQTTFLYMPFKANHAPNAEGQDNETSQGIRHDDLAS
jgi:hypothetical protein